MVPVAKRGFLMFFLQIRTRARSRKGFSCCHQIGTRGAENKAIKQKPVWKGAFLCFLQIEPCASGFPLFFTKLKHVEQRKYAKGNHRKSSFWCFGLPTFVCLQLLQLLNWLFRTHSYFFPTKWKRLFFGFKCPFFSCVKTDWYYYYLFWNWILNVKKSQECIALWVLGSM